MPVKSIALLFLVAGCAKATLAPRGDGGGGGNHDLSGGGGEDSGASVDLASGQDLAGRDFAGVDFAGTADLAGQCVLFPQSGCNTGEKCAWDGTSDTCITPGSAQNGQLCGASGTDDCVKGDECVAANMTGTIASCRAFCATDIDCTQAAVSVGGTAEPKNKAHCLLSLTGTTTSLCTFACSPITTGASGCAAGLGCQTWSSTAVPEFTDCGPIGTVGDGGNCPNGNSDCKSGFGCVVSGSGVTATQHCRAVCRQGMAGADCPAGGFTCAVPTGATMFGFCCPGNC
jgi:hypothetical protein